MLQLLHQNQQQQQEQQQPMIDLSSFPATVITGILSVALLSALFVVKRESSKRRYERMLLINKLSGSCFVRASPLTY